eukprot:c57163_g1_i1 orf=2-157(-)
MCILQSSTFGIHINYGTNNNHISLNFNSNYVLMDQSAILCCSNAVESAYLSL